MVDDPVEIACWQRIGPRLTTSGRLSEADVGTLAELGVTHVINLALPDSPGILADEAARVAESGMNYTNIPVPFDAPTDAHFASFRDTMAAAEMETVHVHCVMNWRVSAFVFRWHRDVKAMPEAQARALMEQQWSPDTNDHKDAAAWTRFIKGGTDG